LVGNPVLLTSLGSRTHHARPNTSSSFGYCFWIGWIPGISWEGRSFSSRIITVLL
jgi:hypothetical protein